MSKMEKVMIIGGPGNISASTISDLLDWGYSPAIFTLPESPTEELKDRVKSFTLETGIIQVIWSLPLLHSPVREESILFQDLGQVNRCLFLVTARH